MKPEILQNKPKYLSPDFARSTESIRALHQPVALDLFCIDDRFSTENTMRSIDFITWVFNKFHSIFQPVLKPIFPFRSLINAKGVITRQ